MARKTRRTSTSKRSDHSGRRVTEACSTVCEGTALRHNPGEVFDIWIDYLVHLMQVPLLEQTTSNGRTRNRIVAALNNFPILCKATRDVARADQRYAPLMFYERNRLGASDSKFFLEGLPHCISFFNPPAKHAYSTASVDVAAIVKTLEKEDVTGLQLDDIPAAVPNKVHALLDRMRNGVQTMKNTKPPHFFKRCANMCCRRPMYVGPNHESTASAASAASARSKKANVDECKEYWNAICARSGGLEEHPRKFCTWQCYDTYNSQLSMLQHCLETEDLHADDLMCRKESRARVSEAMRIASKRNEKFGRVLRERVSSVYLPCLPTHLFFETMKKKLNVDLALLYASSVMAESRVLSDGRVLAGAHFGWRRKPMFYMKPIRKLVALYDKFHVGGNVISNLLIDEPYLRKVRQVAKDLF